MKNAEYDRGYAAGVRWAEGLAECLDINAMEAARRSPFTFLGNSFLGGFLDGIHAAWVDVGGACFCRSA